MLSKKSVKKFEDMALVAVIDERPSEAVLVTVSLSEIEGQIYRSLQGKIEIGAKGYKKLNQYAKISIIKPPSIVFKGKTEGNPYFIYKDGYLRGAIIRAMGIGYTVGGGVVISEQTVNYDVGIVFANELIKSIKNYPESGFMAADDKDIPDNVSYLAGDNEKTFPTAGRKWKYYQLDPWAGGVFVDPRSPNITTLVSSHMQRLSSLSTRINTMVEKQVMRNHPALGMHYITNYDYKTGDGGRKDLIGSVEMYMWKASLSKERIYEIEHDIISGNTFGGIQVISSHQDVTEADEEEVREEKVVVEENNPDDERAILLERMRKKADKYFLLKTDKPILEMETEELRALIETVEGEDE